MSYNIRNGLLISQYDINPKILNWKLLKGYHQGPVVDVVFSWCTNYSLQLST
jgi:hypothetical protein